MRSLGRLVPLALIVSVLGLTGCNGDDGSTEDYVKRLNRMCTDIERELSELDSTRVESPQETAALIDDVIAKSRAIPRRLNGIEPPGGEDGELAERFVTTLEREVEDEAIPALEDLRDAVRRGDRAAAEEAGGRLRGLESSKSDRYARELGAEACAT
jgi:hypothetical protein